jgi:hypothetical protein
MLLVKTLKQGNNSYKPKIFRTGTKQSPAYSTPQACLKIASTFISEKYFE